jgi:mannose-6-phosphate isomerase-like protein (cupin superfamily)
MSAAPDPVYLDDIRKSAKRNTWFRHVVYTGRFSQLVLMSVPPGGEIGDEIHETSDQIFVIVDGEGDAIVAGRVRPLGKHDVVFVRAGTRHNIRNTGREDLKLYTVHAPAVYAEGAIHRTREDAIGAMVSRASVYSR